MEMHPYFSSGVAGKRQLCASDNVMAKIYGPHGLLEALCLMFFVVGNEISSVADG